MNLEPIRDWKWNLHMNRRIDEALSELEREAHVRMRCYDRWIQEGKVSRVDAWDRLERLLSGIKHLRELQTSQAMTEQEASAKATESSSNVITPGQFDEVIAGMRTAAG